MSLNAKTFEFLLSQVRASGVALAGGKVFFYAAGTSTPKTVWLDRGKTTPAANPYTLDSNGTAHIFGDGLYRVVIQDSNEVEKYDRDNISIRDISGNVYDVADYASLNAAVAAIGSTPATLQYSSDVTVTANLVVPSTLELMPLNGAKINHSAYTITINSSTVRWPLVQIFNGTGAVTGSKKAYPEWLGEVATDAGATINKAFAMVGSGGSVELTRPTYPIVTTVTFPPTSRGLTLFSSVQSSITVAGDGTAIDMTAQNENYSHHTLRGISVVGPNNYYAGAMTASNGNGILIGRLADTTNVNAGYNVTLEDVQVSGFKHGLRLRCVINLNVYGKSHFKFNRYGVTFDGGATNSNTFWGTMISLNDTMGINSAGTTGGSLTDATSNRFVGCLIESNHPYGQTAGVAIYLNRSYDFRFENCYTEDNQYFVYLTNGSSGNQFLGHRSNAGSGTVEEVLFSGATVSKNKFINCKALPASSSVANVKSDTAGQFYNEFVNCEGFNIIAAENLTIPYLVNMQPLASDNYSGFGAITRPPQGFVEDTATGTGRGRIEGVGTATATLHCGGMGEMGLGSVVAAAPSNTTITTFEGLTPGQIFVLWNYQITRSVTIKHGSGTGNIVLKPTLSSAISVDSGTHNGTLAYTADAVMNQYGQMIVFYVTGTGRAYEIGRNF